MSTDNRTVINDCAATTGWAGDDTVTAVTGTGEFYEGSGGLSWQASNAAEQMSTTQDSVGAGTFSLDWSDSTLYMLIKDNLGNTYANGGVEFVIGDGTDLIGYDVGGNDAIGVALRTYFQSYKLDVSVVVASPGTNFTNHAGTEANLDQTAITTVGYGSLHLAKAAGPSDNVFMDCFRYIANGSYALTINGGTSGTPETMSDVQGDDVTNGWGMIGNPIGSQYVFFAPTEWGNASTVAEHAFTASGEQWYWLGDNGGGRAVGATHFPFRVIGNATDTGSFIISNVVIVNTGTGAEFDCSSTDVNTLEISGCTIIGLASFQAPSAGGTSRFCTTTIFNGCGQITHNGASMNGSAVLDSTVATDGSALVYNETANPSGEMDNMEFVMGANSHHAIEYGLSSPTTIDLIGCDFSGFTNAVGNNAAPLYIKRTSGTVTINASGCSGLTASGYKTDGATVVIVIDPVTYTVTVQDQAKAAIQGAAVLLYAGTTGNLNAEAAITSITRSGTTATVTTTGTHGLATNDVVLIEDAAPLGALDNEAQFTGVKTITVTGASTFTFTVLNTGATTATRTYEFWDVLINYALTNASGVATVSRTYSADQSVQGGVFLSTGSRLYKPGDITGTIDSATGGSVTVTLLDD